MKKIAQAMCTIVLIMLAFIMIVPMNPALAADGNCNYSSNVKSNDTFILKDQNGIFVGKADSNAYRYYFPKSTPNESEAGRLVLKGISGKLSNHDVINIQTIDKDVWDSDWRDYDLLGGFGNSKYLYYWNDYGDKGDWEVVRPSDSMKTGPIQYGEPVYIRNVDYNEYLVPTDDNWLTTENSAHTWEFIDYQVKNASFDHIDYDTDNATITNEQIVVVGSAEATNKSNVTSTLTVHLTVEEAKTSNFERTEGSEVSVGFTFTAGIPEIASVEEGITISSSQELTYGVEETFTQEFGVEYEVPVAPYTTEVVEATATTADLSVPYTMYFKTPDGTMVESCGIWSGTSYYDMQIEHHPLTSP
ncbi:MAG: hypothetical protein F6K50_35400 [Moorea sp. SIO3I7]|nr:hypothetical protein [Moorena sp. SIO3I7]